MLEKIELMPIRISDRIYLFMAVKKFEITSTDII